MSAYYNDHDPFACDWLRQLIRAGQIPDGEVDDRSITDVDVADLRGFTACHFFAGIGGWAYALRLAGWPDDRPVWTGSPPCQPFSAAGQRKGRDDARHLAPHFLGLVRAARPPVLFGEQVASSEVVGSAGAGAGREASSAPEWAWLDDLCDGLEAAGYAAGAADIPAAGVGAPHIRQRLFFGAIRLGDAMPAGRAEWRAVAGGGSVAGPGATGGLADADAGQRGRVAGDGASDWAPAERHQDDGEPAGGGAVRGLADADNAGPQGRVERGQRADQRAAGPSGLAGGLANAGSQRRDGEPIQLRSRGQDKAGPEVAGRGPTDRLDGPPGPGPADSPWGSVDWLYCRDGKWRPVEPGTFPLADGLPGRVGRLRGYGNAIVPQAAAEFVMAFMEAVE